MDNEKYEISIDTRWTTKNTRLAQIQIQDDNIKVSGCASTLEKELLDRCLVGRFQISTQELIILNNITRWASSTWKAIFGVKCFCDERWSLSLRNAFEKSIKTCTFRRMDLEEEKNPLSMVETLNRMLVGRDQKRLGVDLTSRTPTKSCG